MRASDSTPRRPLWLSAALFLTLPLVAAGADHQTETHRFEEVAPGVYFVTEVGAVYLMSNAMVVVNESDVLVVDSHVTPAAARGW